MRSVVRINKNATIILFAPKMHAMTITMDNQRCSVCECAIFDVVIKNVGGLIMHVDCGHCDHCGRSYKQKRIFVPIAKSISVPWSCECLLDFNENILQRNLTEVFYECCATKGHLFCDLAGVRFSDLAGFICRWEHWLALGNYQKLSFDNSKMVRSMSEIYNAFRSNRRMSKEQRQSLETVCINFLPWFESDLIQAVPRDVMVKPARNK